MAPMMKYSLRSSQQAILAYRGGKMGISAVPGSGKTFTLSALAAQIIRSGTLDADQEVLVVTLVNSAVDNFASRISDMVEQSGLIPHLGYRIRTLHGLAHDIVREKPAIAGLEERFQIVDEHEAEFIRKEAVNSWLEANPFALDPYLAPENDPSKQDWIRRNQVPDLVHSLALSFIRSAKDNRLTPDTLRSLLDRAPAELPLVEMGLAIYSDYQRALTYRGAVDFDDLIRLAYQILDTDSEYLARLQYRYPYILEDEAQDSSRIQEKILRLIAGHGNWVRVGDPNQAIYETFTTANPQYLLDFIHEENVQYRELPESGRSQPSIIDLANQLIQWVMEAHPEPAVRNALTVPYIRPTSTEDPQPNPPYDPLGIKLVHKKYSPDQEVAAVVKSIENWLPSHTGSTIAVLVPRNTRGIDLVNSLREHKIDYLELINSTTNTRLAAGALGNVLNYLSDPSSATKLAKAYQVWRRSWREDETTKSIYDQVAAFLRKVGKVEQYLFPQPGERSPVPSASGNEPEDAIEAELLEFKDVIRRWQRTILLPIDQMVLTLSQELFTDQVDLALAHKLAIVLRQVADDHPDWRLPELTAELSLIARNERRFIGFSSDDSGFDPERHRGKVVVTTIHKAKGLEWDRVYLMSANNYDFPSGGPIDRYISEKPFIRGSLNLDAEALSQLNALLQTSEYSWYSEGLATRTSRMDYVKERLRLLYVGITRAKKELIITWNTGRFGESTPALGFVALDDWLKVFKETGALNGE